MPSGVTAGRDASPGRAAEEAVPPSGAASMAVPHGQKGVGLARHAFADQMNEAGLTGEVMDDAVLVLSELVSNAIRHADPLPSGEITVRWSVREDAVRLEITDGGAPTRPQASLAALSSLGGRGLQIVRTVSSQWGVTEDDHKVTVWADVPRSARDHESGRAG